MNTLPRRFIFVGFVAICHVIFAVVSFDGFLGGDDIGYAKAAKSLIDGNFSLLKHHHSHRLGVILPLALFYKIFGVNDYSSITFSILVQIASNLLVSYLLRKNNRTTWLLAIILLNTDFFQIYHINKIFPDTLMGFWLLLLVGIFQNYTKSRQDKPFSNLLYGFFAALSCLLALLTKETVLFFVPILVVLPLIFYNKIERYFGVSFVAFGTLFLFGYCLFCYEILGDYLLRIHLIAQNSYVNTCSYHLFPDEMRERITFGLVKSFVGNGMFFSFFLSLTGMICAIFSKSKKLHFSQITTYEWAMLAGLLAAQFMSISYQYYLPLCVEGRHYLFLMPLATLASAQVFERVKYKNWYIICALLTLICALFLFLNNVLNMAVFWLLLSFVFLFFSFFQNHKNYFLLSLLLVMLIRPAYLLWKPKSSGHEELQYFFNEHLKKQKAKSIIYTDPVLQASYHYFFQFENHDNFVWENVEDLRNLAELKNKKEKIYFLLNYPQIKILKTNYGKKINLKTLDSLQNELLIEEKNDVFLYELRK